MEVKLEKMTLEKQQVEEMLKLKEQELESCNEEQIKVKMELKKLQKLKEFKPTLTLPLLQSVKDKDQVNKKKKKKGGQDTKKPATPYIMWCKEHWTEVKNENPDAEFSEIASILASDNKKNKKEKDPLKPKRPESAYFLFIKERRAALIAENMSVVEISKMTGEEWKNMTEEQKSHYEKVAKKKNEKYTQEMEVYKQNKEEEAEIAKKEDELLKVLKQEALQLLKKKEKSETIIKKTKDKKNKKKEEKKNKRIDDPNKPKRPPSSFLLFSKETRKDLSKEKPGISNAQLTALISVKWKDLSEEQKQKWNGEAAEAMEIYKKEIGEYNKNRAEIPNDN